MSNFPSTVYHLTKRPEPSKKDDPARTLTQAQLEARSEEEARQRSLDAYHADRAARIELIRQRAATCQTKKEFRQKYRADYSWLYNLHDFDLFEQVCAHMRPCYKPRRSKPIDLVSLCERLPG
ncbi:hypothetical protein R69619_03335 [Paraburkholderia nemoris]|uniref:hypothetical protein n=1 Tax=Paraburkholderia nemoris TaxID=2793076 RepID=UPI00190BFA75|nr:hypothetical protein [Paraburkholderia nemoris]MBK3743353.1 hypothetical protein [Paraburkholderia aspalathi]CAE6760137.1 hypothetical protein R69619_03335 [Paraburkholderia nemoris]